jgi:hypothetical protein
LVKFSWGVLRDEVLRSDCSLIKFGRMQIHFRKWRSISHAFYADLH